MRELPKLKNPKNIVMRFAPSPSGPLHLGHAYILNLNSEYCRNYKGKLIIRIEDTNPENIDKDAYEMIPKDANWATKNNVDKVYIQSDRLEIYYDYAKKIINLGKAYVCTCDNEVFKRLISEKKPCPCRNLPPKENAERFQKMFSFYKQGEAVLRIKTDLENPNPAMRDWPAMRINETPHPRTGKKYRVWPLMNFSVVVDDHEMKVTHTIRAKDHMDNEKRQKYVADYFKWEMPENIYVGRINFIGMPLSTSETRKGIEEGKYDGWEDIRLPFLRALKKRGYQPEAFINYALDVGITKTDKKTTEEEFFKIINHFNKEVIEPTSKRYFFIENPKKVKIKDAPKLTAKLPSHPDYPKLGTRTIKTTDEFYIQDELEKDKAYRFMHLFNFKDNKFISKEYDKELKAKLIHWLPISGDVNIEVHMPNGSIKKGLAEEGVKDVKNGEIIQFERFAFVRRIDKNVFYYLHK